MDEHVFVSGLADAVDSIEMQFETVQSGKKITGIKVDQNDNITVIIIRTGYFGFNKANKPIVISKKCDTVYYSVDGGEFHRVI